MANLLTVNYTQDVLDQMRCCVCKGYLSHSPIRLLPNGTCVCGSCNPPNLDVQIYRNVPLELLLSQLSFLCRNKEHGCLERVLFDQATEHESKCVYRSILCPSLKTCDWEGSTTELYNHFSQRHSELVKETTEFKFKIMEDAEGVFITKKENLLFVIKYLYNVYENCLKYDVRYFRNLRKNEGTYKIQLINDADSECNFNLKTNKCLIFDNSFYDARNAQILKLRKFLELLDNPVMVKVVINLVVVHSGDVSASQLVKLVDYKLLETATCKRCKNYLIPLLYDTAVGIICCICSKYFSTKELTLSTNAELIKIVSRMNYPCQWRNCNFIGNSENIRQHNLSCQFRLYFCRVSNCGAYISLATADKHLQNHKNCHYLAANGVYKFSFKKKYGTNFIWAAKNGSLIEIEHSTTARFNEYNSLSFDKQCLHFIADLADYTATVRFEHEHCNLISGPFVFVSGRQQEMDFSELPPCFKVTDEVWLSITECQWSLN